MKNPSLISCQPGIIPNIPPKGLHDDLVYSGVFFPVEGDRKDDLHAIGIYITEEAASAARRLALAYYWGETLPDVNEDALRASRVRWQGHPHDEIDEEFVVLIDIFGGSVPQEGES